MSSSEDVLEGPTSLSLGAVPYKTFLSALSEASPALQTLKSLSLGSESEVNGSIAISKLCLLLSTLRVPGPCQLLIGTLPLGQGAQFIVAQRDVTGLPGPETNAPVLKNSVDTVAVKTPRLLLRGQKKLDLLGPGVSRQMRNLIIEITALCHPTLRDHRNIVNLLGWGTSTADDQQVPFLALEVAGNTLAGFLCESTDIPISLKHHISLDIACALDALHEIGLIHGDLKPENVLMFSEAEHWVAKLADFGGGADIGQGGSLEGMGTVGWRAPELRRSFNDGTHIDLSLLDRIDSYSYGLLLWSMFLKDKGSAPCTESVEAEMVALSELETNPMSLPMSVHSVLETSFRMLLKRDPKMRPREVGHLLDDGSSIYSDWVLLNNSRIGPSSLDDAVVASSQGHDLHYDWEIPEISMQNANALGSAFLRKKPMATETIHSLFMKYAGSSLLVNQKDPQTRDLLLDLLHSGAEKGSQPLRASIYLVHEYFQTLPRADVYELKLLWMSEAVASGAFFLRKLLQPLNSSLLEKGIQAFQDHGGYNQFYAAFNREAASEALMQASLEDVIPFNRKLSLNPRGDKLLHILSSATAYKELADIVQLMDAQEVNTLNDCGETALYRACMAGGTANVQLLLSRGANASIAPSPGGPTCLHWLFHFNPRDVDLIARELIKGGAPIHSKSEQKIPMLHYPFTLPVGTPLHWTVENSAAEATRALLCQGADPSVRDECDPYAYDDSVRDLDMSLPPDWISCSVADHATLGYNAVDVAVKNRDHKILAILLSNNANFDPGDTDEEGYSAVHRLDAGEWRYTIHGTAIWSRLFQGSTSSQANSLKKTIAILIRYGFKLDKLTNPQKSKAGIRGWSGQTALMIAVATGNTETVKQFLDAGADVNFANSDGQTALLSLRGNCYSHDKERQSQVVSLLLDANANIHARDYRNTTPFLCAANGCLLEVATALLNYGADLRDRITNIADTGFGKTAFAILADHSSTRVADVDEWLVTQLNTHILPRKAKTGDQALHDELLEKADLDGGTLLHYTARKGHLRSCVTLLEAEVSINSIRRSIVSGENVYCTALDEALRKPGTTLTTDVGILEPYSEQVRVEHEKVLRDIAELLRSVGGVESKHLIEKRFNIPPQQDLGRQRTPPKLTNNGA